MDKTTRNMKATMEQMLLAEGYSVVIGIHKDGYTATVAELSYNGEMILSYPDSLTPGDVVFAVRDVLNKINGKD